MTDVADLPAPPALSALLAQAAQTRARLTGPGGPFEIVEEQVRGVRLPVFKNRRASLRDLVAESAALGDREYLVDVQRRITFAEHSAAVAALASGLAGEYGVRKGDRVAIFAGNSADWVMAFWAAASLGAITVGFNAWWSPREVAYALGHSAPRLVLADAKRAKVLAKVLADTESSATPVVRFDGELPDLIAAHARAHLPADNGADAVEDDPAVIMYTSGTTGYPKGVVHSVRNLMAVLDYHRLNDALAVAMAPALAAARTQPRRFLMSLPLFHIASLHNLAIPRLVSGDTVIIDHGPFDLDRVLELVQRERITNWAVVPTMAHRLVNHPDLSRYDLSSLSAVSINSAPSSVALKDRVRSALPGIQGALTDSYGLTESCTAATVATAMDLAAFPTTVGRPVATVSIEIRDPDGRVLSDGESGEICLRSPYNMLGYWGDEQATTAACDPHGWLRTGDIGYLRDGLLYMSTRRSDLILRGGENVYPAEVEAVLDEHPAVVECAVLGIEHADLGEEVAALIVTAADQAVPTPDELHAFARERLAYYKVPSQWRFTNTPLPRTATGKVVRSGLTMLGAPRTPGADGQSRPA